MSYYALSAHDSTQPQSVSAVKVLSLAVAQGQKVYSLNTNNQAMHSTILQSLQIDQDTKRKISDALSAGKEGAVHEKNI